MEIQAFQEEDRSCDRSTALPTPDTPIQGNSAVRGLKIALQLSASPG